jgi:hypothetical protein
LTKAPKINDREKTASSTNVGNGYLHAEDWNYIDAFCCVQVSIQSGSKDLNISPKTLKLLQERVRNTLEHIGIGNNILSRAPMGSQLRERIDTWDYMKQKPAQLRKWSSD